MLNTIQYNAQFHQRKRRSQQRKIPFFQTNRLVEFIYKKKPKITSKGISTTIIGQSN